MGDTYLARSREFSRRDDAHAAMLQDFPGRVDACAAMIEAVILSSRHRFRVLSLIDPVLNTLLLDESLRSKACMHSPSLSSALHAEVQCASANDFRVCTSVIALSTATFPRDRRQAQTRDSEDCVQSDAFRVRYWMDSLRSGTQTSVIVNAVHIRRCLP